MDSFRIQGGARLQGKFKVSGSKNAALPVLFSGILTGEKCHYRRVPKLEDIDSTLKLLKFMGIQANWVGSNEVELDPGTIQTQEAPYDLVRKMRASVLALGPLVARFGKAKVSLPGGCAIGARPINFHLLGLKALGAEIELSDGYVFAKSRRLIGTQIDLDFPSVGATEQLMMAASLAKGETKLTNCAREPEITDLAQALISMGAEVSGAGEREILIQGKDSLRGAKHSIMGDRIEAGTFAIAAAATGGSLEIEGIDPLHLAAVLSKLESCGFEVVREKNGFKIIAHPGSRPMPTDLVTEPYPGFPTDMQAQFMSLLVLARGKSIVTETIFENRFMHVPELCRMGAKISLQGNAAVIEGTDELTAAPVMATDLRASASLIIAALCAKGVTIVNRIYHLDRGYEKMEEKLVALGAKVERIAQPIARSHEGGTK